MNDASRQPLELRLAVCDPGLYDVILDGEVLVGRSRDLEHDAARTLQARGRTGKYWTIDAVTGKRRMLVDIARAAERTVTEGTPA